MKHFSSAIGRLAVVIIFSIAVSSAAAAAFGQSSTLGRTITVPLDHKAPGLGRAPLYFEFGARYSRTKPTVFIIADAQQFYVRRGQVARLQQTLFGESFNVVGIVGRGSSSDFIRSALDANNQPDWLRAWRTFNSEQWIDDIEAVRRAVVGNNGKILLYGRSGGAFLVHQYLAKYGAHAQRAFTQAALNPFIVGELRLNSDHFWEEIGAQDPNLQTLLKRILEQRPTDRATILRTLQRQNFFVPLEKLPAARADLIRSLAEGDTAGYDAARKEYQVDDIERINASPEGLAVRVRVFEFFYPSGARTMLGGDAVYPDLENQNDIAQPLVALCDIGRIPPPSFAFSRLHQTNTEVFILAGRQDHTADYRSAIALAASYPRNYLFIAEDNHTFENLNRSGLTTRIMRAFLEHGFNSPDFWSVLSFAEAHRWSER